MAAFPWPRGGARGWQVTWPVQTLAEGFLHCSWGSPFFPLGFVPPGYGTGMEPRASRMLGKSWATRPAQNSGFQSGVLCDVFPPGYIWQCRRLLTLTRGQGEGAIGIQWVQVRDAAKHPPKHRQPPQQRIIWPQMAIVLRLRNPGLQRTQPTWWKNSHSLFFHLESHSKAYLLKYNIMVFHLALAFSKIQTGENLSFDLPSLVLFKCSLLE